MVFKQAQGFTVAPNNIKTIQINEIYSKVKFIKGLR